jgi:hypothetical protein
LELQIDQHEELHNSTGVVSWELLKHMVRLAKRHAHEEGNKIGAAERETDEWRTRADEANATLRETEQELQRLRQQLANAQREASDEFAERVLLQHEASDDYVELERLRAFVKRIRELTNSKIYYGINVVRAELAELDAGTPEPAPVAEPAPCPDWRAALSELDSGTTEPTQVAEPLEAEGGV